MPSNILFAHSAEKTAAQSTIIRKLSNGKSRTLAALHEYDRLIKSLYVLEYIDNKTLRHYVQQALNRGEAYHQLKRALPQLMVISSVVVTTTRFLSGMIALD